MANSGAWVHGEVATGHISRAFLPWYLVNSDKISPLLLPQLKKMTAMKGRVRSGLWVSWIKVVRCPSSRGGPVAAVEVLAQISLQQGTGCEEFRQQKASNCCSFGILRSIHTQGSHGLLQVDYWARVPRTATLLPNTGSFNGQPLLWGSPSSWLRLPEGSAAGSSSHLPFSPFFCSNQTSTMVWGLSHLILFPLSLVLQRHLPQ